MSDNRRPSLVRRIFTQRGIRASLLGAFIVLTFVPLMILGLVLRRQVAAQITDQVVARLRTASTIKVQEIERFFTEQAEDLENVLLTSKAQDNALYLLRHSPETEGYRLAEGTTYDLFQSVLRQNEDIAELFLIERRKGSVVLSTEPRRRGAIEADQTYFLEGLRGPYASPLLVDAESGETVIYLAKPVRDFSVGANRGVLVARLSPRAIDEVLSERTGMGETGETYLVVPPGQLVTPLRHTTSAPPDSNTHGIREALAGHEGSGLYTNYAGVQVIGYYRWLPEVGAGLLAEQVRDEAFAALDRITRSALVVVSIMAVVTIGVILMLTQRIARPIVHLAAAAEAITAGDWETPIPSGLRGEVGALAEAFQTMTGRLRESIQTLEQRVAERTAALARRAVQLEAAAEVARDAAAIRDVDQLLDETVRLISERFGFYHAGVFLVDDAHEYAVLQAASSEGGRRMLERGHKLAVGKVGMVGYVTDTGEPRIALDVGEDAVHFANPDLPGTRSEMALPLRVRGAVIGALDVQSIEPAAFSDEDVATLQTMADQLAVAIENARLFEQAQASLREVEALYGDYSGKAWGALTRAGRLYGYTYDRVSVSPVAADQPVEVQQALREGHVVAVGGKGEESEAMLAIPVSVRGKAIGVLDIRKSEGAEGWTPEEMALVERVSDQLGLALESARLYRDTQRRAAREQLIGEITARMRETLDVDMVLKTAVQEVRQALELPEVIVRLVPQSPDQTKTVFGKGK